MSTYTTQPHQLAAPTRNPVETSNSAAISGIVAKLKEKGAPGPAVIHIQKILNAVFSSRTTAHASDRVTSEDTVDATKLTFSMTIPEASTFSLTPLLHAVSDPVNCVTAASAKFTPGATPGIEISATISWKEASSQRDRDGGNRLVTKNQIDDSFKHAGLCGEILKAAQSVQHLMINNHPFQPKVIFSIELEPPVVVRAANVDTIDLIRLGRLKQEHKNISDVSIGLFSPHYALNFTIDSTTKEKGKEEDERSRKRFWLF